MFRERASLRDAHRNHHQFDLRGPRPPSGDHLFQRRRAFARQDAAVLGFTSCIVPQWFAWEYVVHLPHGVFLFKGNNNAQLARMVAAHAAGHRAAAIEEEILSVTEPSQILRLFHPKHIDACELFLLQSEHVRDHLIAQFPTLRERMTVTGNPRTIKQ